MQSLQLGIDVAKAKLDCALRQPDGKIRHRVVDNTPAGFSALDVWLAKQGADAMHVCMEATGTYWEAVAEHLAARPDCRVSVINPAQIKAFGASQLIRSKTDKVDAKLIAQFCAERRPDPWVPATPAEQALRALVLRLDALQSMRIQESNRLEVARPTVRDGIVSHLKWLDEEIERVIKAIREHIDSDPPTYRSYYPHRGGLRHTIKQIINDFGWDAQFADLVTGGKVSGDVVFLLPEETGHQYIIWKPGFESTRAIIQAK